MFSSFVSAWTRDNRERMLKAWQSADKGKHLLTPSAREQHPYDSLQRNQAYLLAQLTTGHSWPGITDATMRTNVDASQEKRSYSH